MEGVTPLLIGPMQTNTPTDIRLHRHHPQYILGPEYVPQKPFQRFGDSPKGNSCTKSRRFPPPCLSFGPVRRTHNLRPLIFDVTDFIRNTYSAIYFKSRNHFKSLAILRRVNIAEPNREGTVESRTQRLCLIKK